jgi:hypothetical protein
MRDNLAAPVKITTEIDGIHRKFATIASHLNRMPRGEAPGDDAMKSFPILGLVVAMGLAGCVQPETTSRSTINPLGISTQSGAAVPAPTPAAMPSGAPQYFESQYDVQQINISVPQTLRVSEANTFHPNADIVWRGEPLGDRYAQVKAIFETAAAAGTSTMHSGPKVAVDIEVTYFHCLTEKTRYTVGGVHSMKYMLTVRDLETGAILQGPRLVVADVKGAGGQKAIEEEEAGRTQKVVVTDRLIQSIREELSMPVATVPEGALVTRFDGSPVTLGASQG